HQPGDVVAGRFSLCLVVSRRHGLGCVLVEPCADDGNRFRLVFLGHLADFLHRLGVNLSLHLGDVDHRGGSGGNDGCFRGGGRCGGGGGGGCGVVGVIG